MRRKPSRIVADTTHLQRQKPSSEDDVFAERRMAGNQLAMFFDCGYALGRASARSGGVPCPIGQPLHPSNPGTTTTNTKSEWQRLRNRPRSGRGDRGPDWTSVGMKERKGDEPGQAARRKTLTPESKRTGSVEGRALREIQRTAGNSAAAAYVQRIGGSDSMARPGAVQGVPLTGNVPSIQRQKSAPPAKGYTLELGPVVVLVAHTSGAVVDAYLSSSSFFKGYTESKMKKGTKATTAVQIHNAADFKKEWVAYALTKHNPDTGKTFTKAEAEAWEQSRVNAFQSGGKIHLHEERGEQGTAIHESMHLFSDDTNWTNVVGFNINEGATEKFTRMLCEENKITREGFLPDQLASVEKLVGISSKEKLADAYFNGSLDGIKKDAEAKGKGTWDKWVGFMKAGKYSEADTLLKEGSSRKRRRRRRR